MNYRLTQYDKGSYWILSDDDKIVARVLELSNDQWGLFDEKEVLLIRDIFGAPEDALKTFINIYQNALAGELIQAIQLTEIIDFHGLKLEVPHETFHVVVNSDGEVFANMDKYSPEICPHDDWTFFGRHEHVATVNIPEGFSWKNSLVALVS